MYQSELISQLGTASLSNWRINWHFMCCPFSLFV